MNPDYTPRRPATCLPLATWFLVSESGEPLGQTRGPEPLVGDRLAGPGELTGWVVVSVTELRATCAMRRFRVAVRPHA